MNKSEFIDALSGRLGDRKAATAALEAFLAEVQNAVTKGDKVSITGFGVFEKRQRAARTARNPRTGEAVKVKKTSVPAFRPGATFKEMVAAGKVPKTVPAARKAAPAAKKAAAPTNRRPAAPAKKAVKAAATARKSAPATKATRATKVSATAKKAPAKAGRAR